MKGNPLCIADSIRIWCLPHLITAVIAASLFSAAQEARSQITRDALAPEYSASFLAGRIGIALRATKFANTPVRDQSGDKIGKVQDLFLDLNSGQVLCAMVAQDGAGNVVIVPAKTFRSADARGAHS